MAEYVIGTKDEFPANSHRVVQLPGRATRIGVFNVAGRLYALPNTCPHQFGPLCEGTVGDRWINTAETGWRYDVVQNGEIVTCPWHGIEFDITTGQCLATDRLRVRPYPIGIRDDQVWISTDRTASKT